MTVLYCVTMNQYKKIQFTLQIQNWSVEPSKAIQIEIMMLPQSRIALFQKSFFQGKILPELTSVPRLPLFWPQCIVYHILVVSHSRSSLWAAASAWLLTEQWSGSEPGCWSEIQWTLTSRPSGLCPSRTAVSQINSWYMVILWRKNDFWTLEKEQLNWPLEIISKLIC